MRRLVRAMVLVVVTAVLVPATGIAAVLGSILFLPLPASLPEPREIEARGSRIYDKNGALIAELRRFDLTRPVTPEEIPQVLIDAVLAAEDRRFYSHDGIDPRGTVRALWANVRGQAAVQGGSTITQQYVKNVYLGDERTVERKLREAVLARQVDRELSKDELLFRYLSSIYLGEGAYGVGAAAKTYFRKPVAELTLSEAALLAGLIPAPSRYEPRGNPTLADARRRLVLDAMLEVGSITADQHAVASAESVYTAAELFGPPSAPATVVFPPERPEVRFDYFVDFVERYLAFRYGDDVIYREGLDIYTTLDPRLQLLAEASVAESLEGTSAPLEMSVVSVEPATGYVKAMVGGRDFDAPGGQVNLALGIGGGGTGRQAGSTFKPFVLAAALERGTDIDDSYSGASPVEIGGEEFENYDGASFGQLDLRAATARSVNTVFVRLAEEVGVPEVMATANRLGVFTEAYAPDRHGLSVALGALEVSPLDMASAYGTFAALGERAAPTPVLKVLTADGEVLEDNLAERPRERVLDPMVADTMNEALSGVFGGTAAGHDIGRPAAGKTGTSQDNADAWFVGYTPNLSTAVWLGHRDDRTSLRGIGGFRSVTGGTIPAGTWARYMRLGLDGVPVAQFGEPPPVAEVSAPPESAAERADDRFELGPLRDIEGTGSGGDFVEEIGGPSVAAPPVPTTVPPPVAEPSPVEVPEVDPSAGASPGSPAGNVATTTTTEPAGPSGALADGTGGGSGADPGAGDGSDTGGGSGSGSSSGSGGDGGPDGGTGGDDGGGGGLGDLLPDP